MPAKKRPRRPADLRSAILEASVALITEGGVEALSMREVARRAHVTHGAPYHHFVDRAAIMAALAEEGFAFLTREMEEAMEQAPRGDIERYAAAGRAYVAFAVAHPAHMKIMFRPELTRPEDHPRIDAIAGGAMKLLVECVDECMRRGVIRHGDPTAIVMTSWTAIHGLASLWTDGPLARLHPGDDIERMTDMVVRTLSLLLTRR